MIQLLQIAAVVLLAIGALLALLRLVRGPTILDRMIASDVLLTTLMLTVGADMIINGHTRTVPVMLVIAASATFATIAVARYVSKQDASTAPPRDAEQETPQGRSNDDR